MEKVLGSQIWLHGPADTKDYLIGGVAVEVQTNRKDAEVKNVLGNRVLVENDGRKDARGIRDRLSDLKPGEVLSIDVLQDKEDD